MNPAFAGSTISLAPLKFAVCLGRLLLGLSGSYTGVRQGESDLTWPEGKTSCSQPSHSLPAPKNSSSTFALSKPDIGPQSSPSARAASIKYAPCSDELRRAVTSTSEGLA